MAREEEGRPVLKGAFCHPVIHEQSTERDQGKNGQPAWISRAHPLELNRLLDREKEGDQRGMRGTRVWFPGSTGE